MDKRGMAAHSKTSDGVSHYFIEGQSYTQEDLKAAHLQLTKSSLEVTRDDGAPKEDVQRVITALKEYRFTGIDDLGAKSSAPVLESVTSSAFGTEYRFNFVGVLIVHDYLFFVFPKFVIPDDGAKFVTPTQTARDFMHQVIDVCDAYGKRRGLGADNTDSIPESSEPRPNRAELYRALIEDYLQDGVYASRRQMWKRNGKNQIDWNHTISRVVPYITGDGRPIYADYWSHDLVTDQEAAVRRIQLAWIAYAAQRFESIELLNEVLGYPRSLCAVSHESPQDIGSTEAVRATLLRARNQEFNTRNKKLISLLLLLVDDEEQQGLSSHQSISHLGTAPFENVWEHICGQIFNGEELSQLKRYSHPVWVQDGQQELTANDMDDGSREANNRLIPDVVCQIDDARIIIDAKYYIPQVSRKAITRQPDSYDIIKEYFYQLLVDAYHHQVDSPKREPVAMVKANAFMMPHRCTLSDALVGDGELIYIRGTAQLSFLNLYSVDGVGGVSRLLPIVWVELNTHMAFDRYIRKGIHKDDSICDDALRQLVEYSGVVNAIKPKRG